MTQFHFRSGRAPDRPHDGHFAADQLAAEHFEPLVEQAEGNRFDDEAAAQNDIIEALRHDDGSAFARLFRDHNDAMVARARTFVRDHEIAQEVVQDTWIAMLNGIDRFEGRSSLCTWVTSILSNKARTRARREGRTIPLSSFAGSDGEPAEMDDIESDVALMEPLHSTPAQDPERITGTREMVVHLAAAVDELPASQRAVILMRDIEGRSAEETSELLGLTPGNQRVLLHRGHSRLRALLSPQSEASAA